MKSKEALENIKPRINSLSLFPKVDKKTYYESWKIIEQDLEVLEILKKHFQFQLDDNSPIGFSELQFNGIDINDIYKKGDYIGLEEIKEWLEDDHITCTVMEDATKNATKENNIASCGNCAEKFRFGVPCPNIDTDCPYKIKKLK